MKWVHFLLFMGQGIPEVMGILATSLALGQVPLRWDRIALVGFILATIVFIIRSLPIIFGLHTVVELLVLAVFIAKATYVPLTKSFLVSFLSLAVLAVLELLFTESIVIIFKLDYSTLLNNKLFWTLAGMPQAIGMILLALAISRLKKPLPGAWKS